MHTKERNGKLSKLFLEYFLHDCLFCGKDAFDEFYEQGKIIVSDRETVHRADSSYYGHNFEID